MAMARSNVPKFGNWESEDHVPYTVYFNKARKTRGEKMINPNDPQENPDMFQLSAISPPKARTKTNEPIVRRPVKPIYEHTAGREDVDFRHFSNSTARNDNMGRRPPNESSYGGRANRPNQSTRSSLGSEYSFESAPQGRNAGRAWEGTNNENSHGVMARSRQGLVAQDDNSPEKGATVPRFGDWNEHDPQSAENFTLVFNKVREEKSNPTPTDHVLNIPKCPQSPRIQPSKEPKQCCFPWW